MPRAAIVIANLIATAAVAADLAVYNDSHDAVTVRFEAVGCGEGGAAGVCTSVEVQPGGSARYAFAPGTTGAVARIPCMAAGEAVSFQVRDGCAVVHMPRPGSLVRGHLPDAQHTWTLATGWSGFTTLFAAEEGHIYGIRRDGSLVWYQNTSVSGSTAQRWAGGGGTAIGPGFATGLRHVFGGFSGVIYAIRADGDLVAYRDPRDGSPIGPPRTVASGLGAATLAAGGEGGVIYAVRDNGDVVRLEDGAAERVIREGAPAGTCAGSSSGACLGSRPTVFGGAGGVLYAIDADGALWRYRATATTLSDGALVGRGYDRYSRVFGGWRDWVYGVSR